MSVHLKKSKFIFRNALSSKNASHFPHLAVLAQKYLGIPATFTPSERVFSVVGIVVDKRRYSRDDQYFGVFA